MTIKDFTTKGVNGIRYEFFTEKTYAGKPRAVAHVGTGSRLHKCNIRHCNCIDLDAGSQGHVGTLLVTMQGEEHTYLDTAVWLGAESGFWLNHGRKSDILAWAFAPALYAGEAGNPTTGKKASADNPNHMTACRIRCLALNLIQ